MTGRRRPEAASRFDAGPRRSPLLLVRLAADRGGGDDQVGGRDGHPTAAEGEEREKILIAGCFHDLGIRVEGAAVPLRRAVGASVGRVAPYSRIAEKKASVIARRVAPPTGPVGTFDSSATTRSSSG